MVERKTIGERIFDVINVFIMLFLIILTTYPLYYVFVCSMRTNFAAIPDSLEEAAKIDGANDITILFNIILPLSIPIIAVMSLFYGVTHWNSWFQAMLYIRERRLYPLQLILREILLMNDTASMEGGGAGSQFFLGQSIRYASIIVATLPILFAYPFIQKYFVKGIMAGAVKG